MVTSALYSPWDVNDLIHVRVWLPSFPDDYTLKTQTTSLNPEPYILKPEYPDLSQGESQLKSSMLRVSKALSTQREASQASRDVYP